MTPMAYELAADTHYGLGVVTDLGKRKSNGDNPLSMALSKKQKSTGALAMPKPPINSVK